MGTCLCQSHHGLSTTISPCGRTYFPWYACHPKCTTRLWLWWPACVVILVLFVFPFDVVAELTLQPPLFYLLHTPLPSRWHIRLFPPMDVLVWLCVTSLVWSFMPGLGQSHWLSGLLQGFRGANDCLHPRPIGHVSLLAHQCPCPLVLSVGFPPRLIGFHPHWWLLEDEVVDVHFPVLAVVSWCCLRVVFHSGLVLPVWLVPWC